MASASVPSATSRSSSPRSGAIGHYFGWQPTRRTRERFSQILPFERMHAVVRRRARSSPAAGAYPFELTVPGGPVPCAGVTVVGVLPTHRRRGLLRRMMEAQLRDVRERGEPIAALWASEETIYGRFGYGLASLGHARRGTSASRSRSGRSCRARAPCASSTHDEALRVLPRLYERVSASAPRVFVAHRATGGRRGRSTTGRIGVAAAARSSARCSSATAVPAGYALYRIAQEGSTPDDWKKTVRVLEAFGVDEAATRDIWRFLLEIDWVDRIAAYNLPARPPAAAARRPGQQARPDGLRRALGAARRRAGALAARGVRTATGA